MTSPCWQRFLSACLCISVALLLLSTQLTSRAASSWVWVGPDGKLRYKTDARGNRIMDFSHAGYKGGGVPLPEVAPARTVRPIEGDDTAQIQAAIAAVSALPIDANGLRGAVHLETGTYDVAGTLVSAATGVVLQGSGSGDGGTLVRLTGEPHRFLDITGSGTWQMTGTPTAITDSYVPSGAMSFSVRATSGLRAGDRIVISRHVTEAWIRFMGMDTLTRDGKPQVWLKPGTVITTDRGVAAISGNRLTLDVPLSDSLDRAHLAPDGATVARYEYPGRIEQVGLESLRVAAPAQDKPISERQYTLFRMNAVSDAWVRDVVAVDTHNTTTFTPSVRRVTVERMHVRHTMPFTAPAAPADFGISGTQILLDRCSVVGQGIWPVVTQAGVTGPNVVLEFKSDDAGIAPHQRWATGLLVDDSEFTGGSERRPNIAFSNREYAGSGHGWSVGWAVAWNVRAKHLLIQQPPGGYNWCIGCSGTPTPILWHGNKIPLPQVPSDTFESPGTLVSPRSLYRVQLRDRKGVGSI
jgi:hypothetical protein